jgi:hypothetical protein
VLEHVTGPRAALLFHAIILRTFHPLRSSQNLAVFIPLRCSNPGILRNRITIFQSWILDPLRLRATFPARAIALVTSAAKARFRTTQQLIARQPRVLWYRCLPHARSSLRSVLPAFSRVTNWLPLGGGMGRRPLLAPLLEAGARCALADSHATPFRTPRAHP